ncbi:hypothetical protein CDL15_Pgr018241 [Punica granatum]|uniref:Uncharacterized protein n=1 Tax=Punica granatum TaxID=22663 RepID=A0A218WI55_PUNGR|nr:hypothetical protein CDL15_Pgr018241 [Punica granatum]PKI55521.1 hypothetical protein CRG98_024133 [Punica granatum]
MSVSVKEISVAGDSGSSDDEDDRFGNHRRKKKRIYRGFAGKFRRAKQVLLCSFPRSTNRRGVVSCGDKGVSGNRRCLFCISRPITLESPAESHTSDPNDPAFTHEMLRAMLEKNDFYSEECNPHLDVHDLPSCNRTR